MILWRQSRLDALLFLYSFLQFGLMIFFASHWSAFSILAKAGAFISLVVLMTYNIIVVTHLFTHNNWFKSGALNAFVSSLNSINIGQSVQVYHLSHVRNHHLYNNNQKGKNGKTLDTSSTFSEGKNNDHASLFRYAFLGGLSSLGSAAKEIGSIIRLGKVSTNESKILNLLSRTAEKKQAELRQVRLDRLAMVFGLVFFLGLSWQWTLFCYLPAYYLALSFVNIQNYFEHYGANPNEKAANSVSYYGKIYNYLTFNDGYHQEHHLRPVSHWRDLPKVRQMCQNELAKCERIISPVPAILGFLHRNRKCLHKMKPSQAELVSNEPTYPEKELA